MYSIQHNAGMIGLDQLIYYDDNDCSRLLLETENKLKLRWLQDSFTRYEDGRIRSDMCRLGMLYKFGGYYFDKDIYLIQNFSEQIMLCHRPNYAHSHNHTVPLIINHQVSHFFVL
jgi:mannosyltransferase OCH1-like enzyme